MAQPQAALVDDTRTRGQVEPAAFAALDRQVRTAAQRLEELRKVVAEAGLESRACEVAAFHEADRELRYRLALQLSQLRDHQSPRAVAAEMGTRLEIARTALLVDVHSNQSTTGEVQ